MPSIAKQLKVVLDTLTSLQEYPFSAFQTLSLARVSKDESMHSMDENRLILRRKATNAETGDGFVAIEILGTADRANWMILQFKTKDQMPINAILSTDGWTLRCIDYEVVHQADGSSSWTQLGGDKAEDVNKGVHLKVGNAIRLVAERMLKRFARVDSL